MAVKQKTLEEAAAETLPWVLDDMRDVLNAEGDYEDWKDWEVSERVMRWQSECVLSSEGVWKGLNKSEAELEHIMITLATGGPAYGLRITPTYSFDYDIAFWYQDWFKPKHYITLTAEEAEVFARFADSEIELMDH